MVPQMTLNALKVVILVIMECIYMHDEGVERCHYVVILVIMECIYMYRHYA